MEKRMVHGVFEGGGVKGTGLVGAIEVTQQKGYEFDHVAGTSAGAIVAALIAAGYTWSELKEIMFELDYRKFKDESLEDKIPLFGKPLSLLITKGIYEGDYFEQWIRGLLLKKKVRVFGDLAAKGCEQIPRLRYKLQLIASDISKGKLLVLPGDIVDYGLDPNSLEVARAVRMSMSIPYFYKPVILKDKQGHSSYIVDGGILSNYPVWIFDPEASNTTPLWPTFGYKLVEPDEGKSHTIRGPLSLLAALFSTMMEAHDARYIKDANFMRTIPIETLDVQTTDFDMTLEQKRALYERGKKAALDFFEHWSFEEYVVRELNEAHRRERVWKNHQED